MPDLDDLLSAARAASRQDRIEFRDALARLGAGAIPAMREWLVDPEMGAFAVRVIEKIAAEPEDRPAAIAALRSVDPSTLSEPVARDVADALARLRPSRAATPRGTSSTPPQWEGYDSAPPLEQRFHDAMLDIFRLAGEATRKRRPDGTYQRGYWASYFLRGVRNHGGLAYAHQLMRAAGTTDGFKRLTEEDRLDLTMEALILRPEFRALSSDEECQAAASRLAQAGYQPDDAA